MRCFLLYADTKYPEYEEYDSLGDAKEAFFEAATSVGRYGQNLEASLHIAESEDFIHEYPDYILSLTPRGALSCERT
jgi:hypothetical protein